MIRKTSGNSTEDGSGNQMTVLALPSPPCPLTGMLGGAGECPGLRTGCARPPGLPPASPLSSWSRAPASPSQSLSLCHLSGCWWEYTGTFWVLSPCCRRERCCCCLLLPGRHEVPLLLILKIEKAKISNEKA